MLAGREHVESCYSAAVLLPRGFFLPKRNLVGITQLATLLLQSSKIHARWQGHVESCYSAAVLFHEETFWQR